MNKKQKMATWLFIYNDIIAIFLTMLIILVANVFFVFFLKNYPDMIVISKRDWWSIDTLKSGIFILINIMLFPFLYFLMKGIVNRISGK